MKEPMKLSPELRLLLAALLLLALVGSWFMFNRSRNAAQVNATPETAVSAPTTSTSSSATPSSAITNAAKRANPKLAAAASAESKAAANNGVELTDPNNPTDTNAVGAQQLTATVPTTTPKGINPAAPLAPTPAKNPFAPLKVIPDANSIGSSSQPTAPTLPAVATAPTLPIPTATATQAPGRVMPRPTVTITQPIAAPVRSGGILPTTPIILRDNASRSQDVTASVRAQAAAKAQQEAAKAQAQQKEAAAKAQQEAAKAQAQQKEAAAKAQQEAAKAQAQQKEAAAKAQQEAAKAKALQAEKARQAAAALAARQAAEQAARTQASTAEPSASISAAPATRSPGALAGVGIDQNMSAGSTTSVTPQGQPGVITQLDTGASAATDNAAPALTGLEGYLSQQNLQFNAVVLGPINTAVFKTNKGFVVVSSGQKIPDTDITVSNVSATQVTLSLNSESKILELNKR